MNPSQRRWDEYRYGTREHYHPRTRPVAFAPKAEPTISAAEFATDCRACKHEPTCTRRGTVPSDDSCFDYEVRP